MKLIKSGCFYRNLLIVIMIDTVLVICAILASYMIRFDLNVPEYMQAGIVYVFPLIVAVKIPVFYFLDLYRGMWRYTSTLDVLNIIKASTLATLIITAFVLFVHNFGGFSRSVFAIDWGITILFLTGFRFCVRFSFDNSSGQDFNNQKSITAIFKGLFFKKKSVKTLLIIGAGNCGQKIAREIMNNPRLRYDVAGFLDDHPEKVGKKIHGIPVLNAIENLDKVAEKVKAQEILIAVPSAQPSQMRRIIDISKESGLNFKIIPDMAELINGNVTVHASRDISFRDLLGREPVKLDQEKVGGYIENQTVLVTGAGGSIGSELCRQICRFNPLTLILYDNAETPLYEIDLELKKYFDQVDIVPVLGDIQNRKELSVVLEKYAPQSLFHAAAYKHVPMLESHPCKAVMNNIIGTLNVVECAKEYNVQRFVLMSTDKAVRPASVMGVTKRIAEIVVQNQNLLNSVTTKFMIVRFGNVAGSAGSVVPLFKKQIRDGGPVTVTHPDVTRFFMTIPEACQLILQAGAMGTGGEIFILDMGRPVKIADMAKDMIRFSGYTPGEDIEIKYIGLRKGEKMFEELVAVNEKTALTDHEKITVLNGSACNIKKLNGNIDILKLYAMEHDDDMVLSEINRIIPEYMPYNEPESAYPPN